MYTTSYLNCSFNIKKGDAIWFHLRVHHFYPNRSPPHRIGEPMKEIALYYVNSKLAVALPVFTQTASCPDVHCYATSRCRHLPILNISSFDHFLDMWILRDVHTRWLCRLLLSSWITHARRFLSRFFLFCFESGSSVSLLVPWKTFYRADSRLAMVVPEDLNSIKTRNRKRLGQRKWY